MDCAKCCDIVRSCSRCAAQVLSDSQLQIFCIAYFEGRCVPTPPVLQNDKQNDNSR